MGLKNILGSFFSQKELPKEEDTQDTRNAQEKLMQEMITMGMPRDLYFGANLQNSTDLKALAVSRDLELMQRLEMYSNPFVRGCVKIIIARAIGLMHNGVSPMRLSLADDVKANDNAKDLFRKELKSIETLITKSLLPVTMDAQTMGDGYVKIKTSNMGVVGLISNFSTQPQNVTPIVSNHEREIAFEISLNTKSKDVLNKVARVTIAPSGVARMSAVKSGLQHIQSEQFVTAESMNVFNEKETAYTDSIYGGVLEGCYNSFKNFTTALAALSEARQASATVERFIMHNLGDFSENERKILKETFEAGLKKVRTDAENRVAAKSSKFVVSNHVLPTVGDANRVEIQESTPRVEGLQSIEDVKYSLQMLMANIGFNVDLTPFSDSQQGGAENEGFAQKSLLMDAHAAQIRDSISKYSEKIIKAHFTAKYNLNINMQSVVIAYNSTINRAKEEEEDNMVVAISNRQQLLDMSASLKEFGFEDNEVDRGAVKRILMDIMPKSDLNAEETVGVFVDKIVAGEQDESTEDK